MVKLTTDIANLDMSRDHYLTCGQMLETQKIGFCSCGASHSLLSRPRLVSSQTCRCEKVPFSSPRESSLMPRIANYLAACPHCSVSDIKPMLLLNGNTLSQPSSLGCVLYYYTHYRVEIDFPGREIRGVTEPRIHYVRSLCTGTRQKCC